MTNGASDSFKKRILKECEKLACDGHHIEASQLFRTYFPEFESALPDRFDTVQVLSLIHISEPTRPY